MKKRNVYIIVLLILLVMARVDGIEIETDKQNYSFSEPILISITSENYPVKIDISKNEITKDTFYMEESIIDYKNLLSHGEYELKATYNNQGLIETDTKIINIGKMPSIYFYSIYALIFVLFLGYVITKVKK